MSKPAAIVTCNARPNSRRTDGESADSRSIVARRDSQSRGLAIDSSGDFLLNQLTSFPAGACVVHCDRVTGVSAQLSCGVALENPWGIIVVSPPPPPVPALSSSLLVLLSVLILGIGVTVAHLGNVSHPDGTEG